jgi:membrane fusion protein (multidrug efflux system)
MIIMLVLVGAIGLGLVRFVNFRAGIIQTVMASLADPPQTVSTTVAGMSDWQPSLTAIGTFRAIRGADLSLQQSGIVDKIYFESGKDVAAGDVLLDLHKEDQLAHLTSLQATADGYMITLKRDQGQLAIKTVSRATVDSDEVNLRNARAQVAQQQATVDQMTLKAPFAGRIGLRQVDVGQYLTAGTAIVTLQPLDRIFVDFMLPQRVIDQVRVGQAVGARVDAFAGTTFTGRIEAVNAKVDQTSRNVQVRAIFDNPDHKLLPGMFATVDVAIGKPERHLTLPQTAIVYNPYGDSVYLAVQGEGSGHGGLVARQTFIRTGSTRGDQVAVLSGIEPGATVVTAGQVKLHDGTRLQVDNTVKVPNDPNPQPVDQ